VKTAGFNSHSYNYNPQAAPTAAKATATSPIEFKSKVEVLMAESLLPEEVDFVLFAAAQAHFSLPAWIVSNMEKLKEVKAEMSVELQRVKLNILKRQRDCLSVLLFS
jgi:hypothetical protein